MQNLRFNYDWKFNQTLKHARGIVDAKLLSELSQ